MKTFTFLMILFLSTTVFGQKQMVMEKLEEYGIDENFLNSSLRDHDATHYFEFSITTNDGSKNIVESGHFDPLEPVGSRWILDNVNGVKPSKKQLKKFGKAHNTKQPEINGKVDEASWKINRETDTIIEISFKYIQESLPHKFAFLADCTGTAFINKSTGHLTLAEFKNDKPLKIKIFNVTSLEMTVDYNYIEGENTYFMEREYLDMKVKLAGKIVEVEEINEYANYKKVK